MVYYFPTPNKASRPRLYEKPGRQRAPRQVGHGRTQAAVNADIWQALRDFESYKNLKSAAIPDHFISGGYNVVFKTKIETHDTGESIKVFVWADSRTQAINKALKYVPNRIIENADEYMVTTMPAGRVDPHTPVGVVPCPSR